MQMHVAFYVRALEPRGIARARLCKHLHGAARRYRFTRADERVTRDALYAYASHPTQRAKI